MRRRWLTTLIMPVVALGLLAASAEQAGAWPVQPEMVYAHWPVYRWAGVRDTQNRRTFWVFDRTGDPLAWQALNEIAQRWNANPDTFGGTGLPLIAPYQDNANIGVCNTGGDGSVGFANGNQYSVGLLCEHELNGFGGTGMAGYTWSLFGIDSHATYQIPYIIMDLSGARPYYAFKRAEAHELGHMMGLGHSSCTCSLMYEGNLADAVDWFSDVDMNAFKGFYFNHPHD